MVFNLFLEYTDGVQVHNFSQKKIRIQVKAFTAR